MASWMINSSFTEEKENLDLNFLTVKTDQGQDFELKFHNNNVHTFKFYFSLSIKDQI